jgi:hypothetical protein
MADEKGSVSLGTADKYLGKVSNWLSERIAAFVAFLFLLFGAGAVYGAVIVPRFSQLGFYLLAAPVVLALVAYYNRSVATLLFAGLVLFFVL